MNIEERNKAQADEEDKIVKDSQKARIISPGEFMDDKNASKNRDDSEERTRNEKQSDKSDYSKKYARNTKDML